MGTYLSTPVTEKGEESGHDPDAALDWGVVDMQGWRKSMEDAHVAQTDVPIPGEKGNRAKVFGVFDGHGGAEVARFCQLYMVDVITKQKAWQEIKIENGTDLDDDTLLEPASTPAGRVLIEAFHALDRMIDDRERYEELILLQTDKPSPGERRITNSISIPPPRESLGFEPLVEQNPAIEEDEDDGNDEEHATPNHPEPNGAGEEAAKEADESTPENGNTLDPDAADPAEEAEEEEFHDPEGDKNGADDSHDDSDNKDDDSNEVTGKEAASQMDQDLMTDDDEHDEMTDDHGNAADPNREQASPSLGHGQPGIVATKIQNGRQICNLPDHPIHAGCTAVVIVMVGRVLTIANAGDSRAVLCRVGGRAEPLSFDHKPQQDREMNRITKAGGFVNQFGRVNGNLNLSRSIGDLKYKQIPGLTPAEQMITAEPDIMQVELHPKDEFVIIGCDGIWDCLSNDQAVKYVRERIDTMKPTEIGAQMLDEIISDDPRATQGIGGDNMTVMIIDLQPQKRDRS